MFSSVSIDRVKNRSYKKALSRNDYLVETIKNMAAHETAKIEALIRFHFKIDATLLTDDELGAAWGDLKFALEYNKLMTGNTNPLM